MTLLSPGVEFLEDFVELSEPSEGSPIACYAGNFAFGTMFESVEVSSVEEFVRIFGSPHDTNYQDWYQVFNYLQYGERIAVCRIGGVEISPYGLNKNPKTLVIPDLDYTKGKWNLKVNCAVYPLEATSSNKIETKLPSSYPGLDSFTIEKLGNYLLITNKTDKVLKFEFICDGEIIDGKFPSFTYNKKYDTASKTYKLKSFKFTLNPEIVNEANIVPIKPDTSLSAGKYSLGMKINGFESSHNEIEILTTTDSRQVLEEFLSKICVDFYKDFNVINNEIVGRNVNDVGVKESRKLIEFSRKIVDGCSSLYEYIFDDTSAVIITEACEI